MQISTSVEGCDTILGLGTRGTQVKSSIQDIVDEVAPMGLRADSFECDVTRLIRSL